MLEIVYTCAQEAFLNIGSLIIIFIIIFNFINHVTNNFISTILLRTKKIHPIIGALMGVIPGCGGGLILIPLYLEGSVSFGCIIASLISTLGDSSFVLISSDIRMYIKITIICFITGIILGYIVDNLNLEIILKLKNNTKLETVSVNKNKITSKDNLRMNTLLFLAIMYIITILIFTTLRYDINNEYSVGKLSLLGIIFSIVYVFVYRFVPNAENYKSTFKSEIIHIVYECSYLIVWIFIAFIIYEVIIKYLGGEEVFTKLLFVNGTIGIVIGALLGIIPGCGIQILIVSLFLKGLIPIEVVIANAISQDGDALLPLIAMNKKAALWATIITTIPGIAIGCIIYLIK